MRTVVVWPSAISKLPVIKSEDVLSKLDGLSFISQLFDPIIGPDQKSEVKFLCPFHGDNNPSASFNIDSKLFFCYRCGAKGSAIDILAKVTNKPRHVAMEGLARQLGVSASNAINPEMAERFHHDFKLNAAVQEQLLRKKGITLETATRFRLGWDGHSKRMTIPVRDDMGSVVNLRLYDLMKEHDPKHKMLNLKGHGKLALMPLESLQAEEVIITEGELKAIGLIQYGFNAISVTGGASGWVDKWNHLFKDKEVVIIYDVDDTGVAKGRALARRLKDIVKQIKFVKLPLRKDKHPKGDVLDYLIIEKYTSVDLRNLIIGTQPFEEDKINLGLDDALVYEVDLNSSSKAQYHMKKIKAQVVVSAKDTAPYVVPKEMRIRCGRDIEQCVICPVFKTAEDDVWEIDADDDALLHLIDIKTETQMKEIRTMIGIPGKCSSNKIVIVDSYNLEEVRLIPQMAIADNTASEQTVVRAYHVGHGIETNASYEVEARSTVMPNTQHSTLLLYKSTPSVDNLSTFQPTEEELQELVIFQPDSWSVEDIDKKMHEIYDDFEANVTGTRERFDLHAILDLAWHSVLYVTMGGNTVKGWADVAIVGDSGQAKSWTSEHMLEHYGLGERIVIKGASVAGLSGGLQDYHGRWFVTWGTIPLNDRRLVILEEVKGCNLEVLQALTDMRSSGTAEITKIERRRTNARTRLIWISNPRSTIEIRKYNFGVETLKQLMGSLEDVRRFDAALIVASGEVDLEVINRMEHEAVPHVYISELCQRLILWSWSRQTKNIRVSEETRKRCLELAVEQSQKYSSSIPLVEPADHRYKLIRLAAAVAARTFSCDESGENLIVRPGHVEWVAQWLDSIYGTSVSGYAHFSKLQKLDHELSQPDEIRAALARIPFSKDTVQGLLRASEISLSDIMDWTASERDIAKDFLSLLVRRNALTRKRYAYYKTAAFIKFLREVNQNELPEPPEDSGDY